MTSGSCQGLPRRRQSTSSPTTNAAAMTAGAIERNAAQTQTATVAGTSTSGRPMLRSERREHEDRVALLGLREAVLVDAGLRHLVDRLLLARADLRRLRHLRPERR